MPSDQNAEKELKKKEKTKDKEHKKKENESKNDLKKEESKKDAKRGSRRDSRRSSLNVHHQQTIQPTTIPSNASAHHIVSEKKEKRKSKPVEKLPPILGRYFF